MSKKQKIIYGTDEDIKKLIEDGHHIDGIGGIDSKIFFIIYTPKLEKQKDNTETLEELTKIVNKWNSVYIPNKNKLPNRKQLPKIRKITPTMKSTYINKRSVYKYNEIIQGITNYIIDITNRKQKEPLDTYYNHRFTLQAFLKQSNGLDRFINI